MKAPTAQEIIALETDYRHYYNRDIDFPNDYPTGVLLGCVDVVDVLSQDDYKQKFGGDRQDPMESQSPFVFICENPQELFIKFPNKGELASEFGYLIITAGWTVGGLGTF